MKQLSLAVEPTCARRKATGRVCVPFWPIADVARAPIGIGGGFLLKPTKPPHCLDCGACEGSP